MKKSLIILISIISLCFSLQLDKEDAGVSRQMSVTFSDLIWRYEPALIEKNLKSSVENYNLQGVKLFDGGLKEYHTAWLDKDTIKYQKGDISIKIPNEQLFRSIRQEILRDGKIIGELILFFNPVKPTNIINQDIRSVLTTKELSFLSNISELTYCIDPDWMPYERINNKGNHEGLTHDMIYEVQTRLQISMKLILTKSWHESLEYIKQGRCTLLAAAAKTESREKYLKFTQTYIKSSLVIAVRNEELFVENLSSIKDKIIGIVKNYAYKEMILKQYPNFKIIEVKNVKDGLERVGDKEIFGFVDTVPTIGYQMRKDRMVNLKIGGKLDMSLALSMAIGKFESPELLSILNKTLNSFSEQDKQMISDKWFSIIQIEKGFEYAKLWPIILIVVILFIIILYRNKKLIEKTRLHKELLQSKNEAQRANRIKSEFIANISHEIRTPLNAVIGFSELLDQTEITSKQRSYLDAVQMSGKTLLSLINDILDLSKVEAGKMNIEKKPTNICQLLLDIEQIFTFKCEEKNLKFHVKISKEIPRFLILDEARLRQVLFNLVGNAVKFTHKGKIEVSAYIKKKGIDNLQLHIDVKDTGIGIPTDQYKKIFGSFVQQEGQSNHQYGGTGLGLAISKKLVELMDGKIVLESIQDIGSIFSLEFYNVLISESNYKKNLLENKLLKQIQFKSATILIADDIKSNRQLIISTLEEYNFKIIEAQDGLQVISICQNIHPNLIFMDLRMPNMDGVEATLRIKENKELTHIPIIAMTASLSDEIDTKLFQGVLNKPITPIEIILELKKHLVYRVEGVDDLEESPIIKLDYNEIKNVMNKEIILLWKNSVKSGVFDDIKIFGEALYDLGKKHQIQDLIIYSKSILEAVDNFDVRKLNLIFSQFNKLMSKKENFNDS